MNDASNRYDPTNIDEILNQNWVEVFPRVLKYAHARSRKYFWIGDAAVNPEDLVNEAVARALGVGSGGTYRNWNKVRYPDIVDFLFSIIDSMTNHEAEHAAKFKTESIYFEDGTEKLHNQVANAINCKSMDCDDSGSHQTSHADPEISLIHKQEYDLLVTDIKLLAKDDEEMEMIFMSIEDGISKAADISDATGYDIKLVYKVLRRLRSKLEKIRPIAFKKGKVSI